MKATCPHCREEYHHFKQQKHFMILCDQKRETLQNLIVNGKIQDRDFQNALMLWARLIEEEVMHELLMAVQNLVIACETNQEASVNEKVKMITEIADGIVDSVYVIDGLSNLLGLPRDELFAEVHRSNMAKAVQGKDGKLTVLRREDGKILKPEGWKAPDLERIIRKGARL